MTDAPSLLQIVVAAATVLAAGTTFISALSAAASKRAAESAQESAIEAWRDSSAALTAANQQRQAHHDEVQDGERRKLRAPLGHELELMSSAIVANRIMGTGDSDVPDTLEIMARISEKSLATHDPTATKFTRWVRAYSRHAEMGPADIDRFMEISGHVSKRVREWIHDSDATMSAIRSEPPLPNAERLDPEDPNDYRNP